MLYHIPYLTQIFYRLKNVSPGSNIVRFTSIFCDFVFLFKQWPRPPYHRVAHRDGQKPLWSTHGGRLQCAFWQSPQTRLLHILIDPCHLESAARFLALDSLLRCLRRHLATHLFDFKSRLAIRFCPKSWGLVLAAAANSVQPWLYGYQTLRKHSKNMQKFTKTSRLQAKQCCQHQETTETHGWHQTDIQKLQYAEKHLPTVKYCKHPVSIANHCNRTLATLKPHHEILADDWDWDSVLPTLVTCDHLTRWLMAPQKTRGANS